MLSDKLLLFSCLFVTVFVHDEATPLSARAQPAEREVNTSSGRVRGFLGPSGVFEFLDIPYATVPKGPNKFGPPLPPITWDDTLNATARNIVCPQPIGDLIIGKNMQEECLVTSVFAPVTVEEKLPVLVYVHGGAFQVGDGNSLKPYDLVRDHNIVAVTFNYRLGAHGFLCLGTDDVPGNAGMKDQVALLRWVQNNIASFGGNPEDVTLAGYSAGAGSADLLMLSKSTNGLFNKVIPESGANIAVYAILSDPIQSAKAFAKSLGFDNFDDINALEDFYKNANFDQLISDTNPLDLPDGTLSFSPCVERPSSEQNRREVFLDKSPREILESGDYTKVPLLYGFTSMDGLLQIPLFDIKKTRMNESFSDFLPGDLVFESAEERESVSQTVRQFYFNDGPIDDSQVLGYVYYYTDIMFTYPTLRSTKIQATNGHNQIYLYEFNYVDEQSTLIPYTDGLRGADHTAQTVAVHGGDLYGQGNFIMTEEYTKLVISIQQLWVNFIKTGKPIPEGSNYPYLPTSWPPASSNWSPYMSIGNVIELKEFPLHLSRAQFWEGIYDKYYRDPSPPIPVEVEGNSASTN